MSVASADSVTLFSTSLSLGVFWGYSLLIIVSLFSIKYFDNNLINWIFLLVPHKNYLLASCAVTSLVITYAHGYRIRILLVILCPFTEIFYIHQNNYTCPKTHFHAKLIWSIYITSSYIISSSHYSIRLTLTIQHVSWDLVEIL